MCKCCYEWWYSDCIKQGLCPNCYDYFKELKQQLAEKQNTIDEINKEFVQAVHDWKTLCAEKDKEIEEKMMSFEKRCQEYYKSDEFKRDFAIQELEKVKTLIQNVINFEKPDFVGVYDAINKQIIELKKP